MAVAYMKKVLHFLPSILIFSILVALMFVLCVRDAHGDPSITPWDVITDSLEFLFKGSFRLGLPLFLAADWLLSRGKWYGGLLPAPMCAYLVYDYYTSVGPRVVDARIIAMIIAGCYLLRIAAVFIVRAVKAKKE